MTVTQLPNESNDEVFKSLAHGDCIHVRWNGPADTVNARRFREIIDSDCRAFERIHLELNSFGGLTQVAVEIGAYLRNLPQTVTTSGFRIWSAMVPIFASGVERIGLADDFLFHSTNLGWDEHGADSYLLQTSTVREQLRHLEGLAMNELNELRLRIKTEQLRHLEFWDLTYIDSMIQALNPDSSSRRYAVTLEAHDIASLMIEGDRRLEAGLPLFSVAEMKAIGLVTAATELTAQCLSWRP